MKKLLPFLVLVFLLPSVAFGAIALDSSSQGGQSASWSHTTAAGSNMLMLIGIRGDGAADTVTGVTYNGVAATRELAHNEGANRWAYIYCLVAPASGANTVAISVSSGLYWGMAETLSGANQSCTLDAMATSSTNGTSLTTNLTTVTDNAWTFMTAVSNVNQAAGAGSTQRQLFSGDNAFGIYDSNGPIHPAGSTSMTVTANSGGFNEAMVAIAPVAVAASAAPQMQVVWWDGTD